MASFPHDVMEHQRRVPARVASMKSQEPGLRDLLGGALPLAAWLALWSVTWAAVAGPLRPGDAQRADAQAVASRA